MKTDRRDQSRRALHRRRLSTANLLGTEAFGELIEKLRGERISVSSYAIGPRRDAALLAAIANQTGGNLYVDEAMVLADDAAGVSVERANEENLRRGARVGETLADWTPATVVWPEQVDAAGRAGRTCCRSRCRRCGPTATRVVFGSTDKTLPAPAADRDRRPNVAGKPTIR